MKSVAEEERDLREISNDFGGYPWFFCNGEGTRRYLVNGSRGIFKNQLFHCHMIEMAVFIDGQRWDVECDVFQCEIEVVEDGKRKRRKLGFERAGRMQPIAVGPRVSHSQNV